MSTNRITAILVVMIVLLAMKSPTMSLSGSRSDRDFIETSKIHTINKRGGELRFIDTPSTKPLVSSTSTKGVITVTVQIPLTRVFDHEGGSRFDIPGETDLLKKGYPPVPSLLFRYVVPDESVVTSISMMDVETAIIRNLYIAPFNQNQSTSYPNSTITQAGDYYPRETMNDRIYNHIDPQSLWCGNEVGTIVLYPLQYDRSRMEARFYYKSTFVIKHESPNSYTSVWKKLASTDPTANGIDLSIHNLPRGFRTENEFDLIVAPNAPQVIQLSLLGMSTYGRRSKRINHTATTENEANFIKSHILSHEEAESLEIVNWSTLEKHILSTWKSTPGLVMASGSENLVGNAASLASFMNYPFLVGSGDEGGTNLEAVEIARHLIEEFKIKYVIMVGEIPQIGTYDVNTRMIILRNMKEVLDWYAVEKGLTRYNARLYLQDEIETYTAAKVVNRYDVDKARPSNAPSIIGHEYVVIYDSKDDAVSSRNYYEPANLLTGYHSGIMDDGDGHSFWYIRENIVKYYYNNYNTIYFALIGDGDDNVNSNGGGVSNNGGQFDIPTRFLSYPGYLCHFGGRCSGDPPMLPTDLFYEDLNQLDENGLYSYSNWSPDIYLGRVISNNVNNTQKYVQLARSYYVGEIDSNARLDGRFWMNNAHAMFHEEFEGDQPKVNNMLNGLNYIEQVYDHIGADFSGSNLKAAIDGSIQHTGALLYVSTHGGNAGITTNQNGFSYSDIPGEINHRFSFVIIDSCAVGYMAGPPDNQFNFASSLLKNTIGNWAFTTIVHGQYGTNLFAASIPLLDSNTLGYATAWGRKNYFDSGLASREDIKTIESLFLFGDPKATVSSRKVDIGITNLQVSDSYPHPGNRITITTSGTINNDNQWSNVRAEFYFDGQNIGHDETGEWVETGDFTLSLSYQIPSETPSRQYPIEVRVADSDYWVNEFSYGIDIDATNADDWQLSDWTPSDNKRDIYVNVTPICYSLVIDLTPAGSGWVSKTPSPNCVIDSNKYTSGTQVQLIASPASDYSFAYWSGDASGIDNPINITMDGDKNVTARFLQQPNTYTLTFDTNPRIAGITVDGSSYSATELPKTFTWKEGSTHSFDVAQTEFGGSDTRYVFTNWNDGSQSTSRTVTVSSDTSYIANYKTQYYLTVNTDPTGLAAISGSGWKDSGSTASTGTAPNTVDNYTFTSWKMDGSSVSGNPIQVYMDAPHTTTAHYQQQGNTSPTLSWTGEPDYVNDGLHPEAGGTSTSFEYRIKYTDPDNDSPNFVRVHIKRAGAEINESPFDMSYVSGDYNTGAIYNYTTTLTEGTKYTYYFEAQDNQGSNATPTSEKDGPDVTPDQSGDLFGDVNSDCHVNTIDIMTVISILGFSEDDPGYIEACNLNKTDGIDMGDVQLAADNWGESCDIVTSPDWIQKDPQDHPSGRIAFPLVYDSNQSRVILFGGGLGSGQYSNETWSYDGSNWSALLISLPLPPVRAAHAMAYDSSRNRVVMFGGLKKKSLFNDTWEFDGTTWTEKTTANSPPARHHHAMVYDSARQQVVLFGGDKTSSYFFGDTWEYGGDNWTQKNPANHPSARRGHAMAYDSHHSRTVLFGGVDENQQCLGDTWEYDGNDWVQTATDGPAPRNYGAMVYDAARQKMVLFGGGGCGNIFNDTWEYSDGVWTEVSTDTAPSPRGQFGMAYDPAREMIVLFGGGSNYDDTWEYGR